jgi:hypothetical protein
MTHDIVIERLDEWATGDLPASERAEVDLHLAGCAGCRAEAEALRTLLAEVDALPAEILPERDLWSGIAARLEPRGETLVEVAPAARRRALMPRWAMQAAAMVALMVGTSVISFRMGRTPGEVPPTEGKSTEESARRTQKPQTALAAWQEGGQPQYETAIAELETVLDRNRSRLSPETVRVLEQNLAIIDEAIRQAREALRRDPNSPEVAEMLSDAYDQKLNVLQQAVAL